MTATPVRIKRLQFQTWINTTPSTTPTWDLLNKATSGKETMNPKVTNEIFITDPTATISVDAYAPTMPVRMTAYANDPVFEYIKGLKDTRAIIGDCETQIINVNMFEAAVAGAYPAYQQPVAIQVDDFGDEGGVRMQLNFTLNYQGLPTAGTFNPTTKTFTAT